MKRIDKYRTSFINFIKNNSEIYNKNLSNESLKLLKKLIKKNDLIFPIALLTLLNNQNKKNNTYNIGYYCSTSILLLDLILELINNKNKYIQKYNNHIYGELKNFLLVESYDMLYKNFKNITTNKSTKIILLILKYYNYGLLDFVDDNNNFATTDKLDDIDEFILTEDLANKYKEILQISTESYNYYIKSKYGYLSQITILWGWILGCGNSKDYEEIIKLSQYFSSLISIYRNFINFYKDLTLCSNTSHNYIINYGMEESYQVYLYNKEKFITNCTKLDIFTETIKEILNEIDYNVDIAIERTSNCKL